MELSFCKPLLVAPIVLSRGHRNATTTCHLRLPFLYLQLFLRCKNVSDAGENFSFTWAKSLEYDLLNSRNVYVGYHLNKNQPIFIG